jgi:hypothetical protein
MIDATPSTILKVKVKVEVYAKNSEVTGEGDALEETGSTNAVNIELAADGTSIVEVIVEPSGTANKGVEEMIRLRGTTSGGSSGDWLLCRTFPIIWFDGAR